MKRETAMFLREKTAMVGRLHVLGIGGDDADDTWYHAKRGEVLLVQDEK